MPKIDLFKTDLNGFSYFSLIWVRGRCGCDCLVVGFKTTCEVVSSNPVHGAVYLIQHYLCDKVCQWLETGGWFSLYTPVPSTNKYDHHHIYNWNIVGCGVKHQKPTNLTWVIFWMFYFIFNHNPPPISFWLDN